MLNDIKRELLNLFSGQTIDTLIPPILFIVLYQTTNITFAISIPIILTCFLFIYRMIKKSKWYYAIGGFIGVWIATAFVVNSGNAKDYYLPDLYSSILFFIVCLLSLLFRRPFAAWLSHLTHAWPIEWFWRDDIRPAYNQVTWIWAVYFIMRFFILFTVYQYDNPIALAISNLLLNAPSTIGLLIISYIYGLHKLKTLKGPSVEEFRTHASPPYKGQKKGF